MYGGKFAFQNRLGWPYSWKEIYRLSLFYLVFEGNFQVQARLNGAFYRRAFCITSLGGLFSAFYRNLLTTGRTEIGL